MPDRPGSLKGTVKTMVAVLVFLCLAVSCRKKAEAPECLPDVQNVKTDAIVLGEHDDRAFSRRMAMAYRADVRDRLLHQAGWIEWAEVAGGDLARRQSVLAALKERKVWNEKDLQSAEWVFHHGTCAQHYKLALALSTKIWEQGKGSSEYSLTAWRYLLHTGRRDAASTRDKSGQTIGMVELNRELYRVGPGAYDLPLKLPSTLSSRRQEMEQLMIDAQQCIVRFATSHGWGQIAEDSYFDLGRMMERPAPDPYNKLWQVQCRLGPYKDGVFLASRLLTVGINGEDGSLLPDKALVQRAAHMLAHALQARLAGAVQPKGPVWLTEGFAQLASGAWTITDAGGAIQIVHEEGPPSDEEKQWAQTLQRAMQSHPLEELIAIARTKELAF